MKIYLVYLCNNDVWEDYAEKVVGAFQTRERAVESILAKGYKPHECESGWEKERFAGRYDSEPDEWGEYASMWVEEMEVVADDQDASTEQTCENTDTDNDSWFECSECGCYVLAEYLRGGYGTPNYCPGCGRKVEK